jgi:hypothetical protein
MIIYLAGRGHGARKMLNKLKYEHVLLSFFEYSKRNYRWLKRRRKKEKKL